MLAARLSSSPDRPNGAKRKVRDSVGTKSTMARNANAADVTYQNAALGVLSVRHNVLDHDRLMRMRLQTPTTNVTKVTARATGSAVFIKISMPKTSNAVDKITTPCKALLTIFRVPNSGSFGDRGDRRITSVSLGSASKAIAQAGSIISSRNTM